MTSFAARYSPHIRRRQNADKPGTVEWKQCGSAELPYWGACQWWHLSYYPNLRAKEPAPLERTCLLLLPPDCCCY